MLSPNFAEICRQVLELDSAIRFVGIASMDAKILAAEYRKGIAPLLTREESELSIMQSLMRMSIRRTLEGKLGKTVYATAIYQKVKRATIQMYTDANKPDAILMMSFEREAELELTILNTIMPYMRKIGKDLRD